MRKRVTFLVDDDAVFQTLREVKGDTTFLGARIVAALLAEPDTSTQIGLAYYGVVYDGSEPISSPAKEAELPATN